MFLYWVLKRTDSAHHIVGQSEESALSEAMAKGMTSTPVASIDDRTLNAL